MFRYHAQRLYRKENVILLSAILCRKDSRTATDQDAPPEEAAGAGAGVAAALES